MEKKARLIVTDSQFNVFTVLSKTLDGKTGGVDGKNLIFCDEKVSLMAERIICERHKGSFNTDVYSFGNFLRVKKLMPNILSREGSAMAVKRVLAQANLKCFSPSRTSLAPSLFDLIIQLKSAKVTPEDILNASTHTDGVLKNKLVDVYEIFTGYENFLKENGFEDQSSMLSYLPQIIDQDKTVKDADVYLVGFSSWTNQARSVVSALLRNAKSVTAILTDGENKMLYVGETVCAFKALCKENGILVEESFIDGNFSNEGRILADNIFNPQAFLNDKQQTDNVFISNPKSIRDEIEQVAQTIKALVTLKGYRYSDITIALSDVNEYRSDITSVFNTLDIPYFLDEKKKPENHPLITLITAYIDVFRKKMERTALANFYKNPLFCADKSLIDGFENYVLKYNINFSAFKKEFTFEKENKNTALFEQMRARICECFQQFNIKELLHRLDVQSKLVEFSKMLNELGEYEERAVNDQIYDVTVKLLDEMQLLLGNSKLTLYEIKSVFTSGVMAMELSIIPQYSDAVFIGAYREVSLASPKILFAIGLNDKVPYYKKDVALLSDGEINRLSDINVLVEPKIRVVNQRTCESVGLSLSSFSEKLFLSCPAIGCDGKKNAKSEVITYAENLFEVRPYNYKNGYLTEKQGLITFAKEYGEYRVDAGLGYDKARAFLYLKKDDDRLLEVIEKCNRKTGEKLNSNRSLIKPITSPTTIEDYYKCPYGAFASHILKLKDREQGKVDALSVGNFIHAVLEEFIKIIDGVNEQNFNSVFETVVVKVLGLEEFSKFMESPDTKVLIDGVVDEAKKHCRRIFYNVTNSSFKPYTTEKKFLMPISDKVSLTGKVDRIDVFGDYYVVMDYKTGSTDSSATGLFTGKKLQLYLYAKGAQTDGGLDGKTLAGAYYMPLNDDFKPSDAKKANEYDGKILKSEQITNPGVAPKSVVEKEVMNAYVDYAMAISKQAAEQMADGVIAVSPYQGSCDYCKFKGLCGKIDQEFRTVSGVDDSVIVGAVSSVDEVQTGKENDDVPTKS